MQRYSCIVNMFFCAIEEKDYSWFLRSAFGLMKGHGIEYEQAYASVTAIVSGQGGDSAGELMEYIAANMTEKMYADCKDVTCTSLKKRIERKEGGVDCTICPIYARYTNTYEDAAYQIFSGYMTKKSARDIQSAMLKQKDYEAVFKARDIVFSGKRTLTIPTYSILYDACNELPVIYKLSGNEDYLNDDGKERLKECLHEKITGLFAGCTEDELQTILFRTDLLYTFIMNGSGLLPNEEKYKQSLEKTVRELRNDRRRKPEKTAEKPETAKEPIITAPEQNEQKAPEPEPKDKDVPKQEERPVKDKEVLPKVPEMPDEELQAPAPSGYSPFWQELLSGMNEQESVADKKRQEKQEVVAKKEDFSEYMKQYVNARDKLFLPTDSTELDRDSIDRFYYLLIEERIRILPFEMVSTDQGECMVFYVHDKWYHIRDYNLQILADSKVRKLVRFVTGRPFLVTAVYGKHLADSVYMAYVNSLDPLDRVMLQKNDYSMTGLICKILQIRKPERETDLFFLLTHYEEVYHALTAFDRKGYKELLRIAEYRSISYLGRGLVTKPGFQLFECPGGLYRMTKRISDLQIERNYMRITVSIPGIHKDEAEQVLSMVAGTDTGKSPAWLLDADMERGEFHYLCLKRESADAKQYLHLLFKFWTEHLTECRCIRLMDIGGS